jgi:predicted DsbA family dithiol-disulfide isomerase
MQSLGVEVVALPYELHPEIPVEGLTLRERWGARYEEAKGMYARIEAACADAGLPFRRPERIPNTRRVLQTAEAVRRRHPEAFAALDRSLFDAHFVEGRFLGDPDVLDELVTAAGAPAAEVRAAVETGELRPALRESMEAAMEAGVTGTPAWLFDGKFLLPGAQPRDVVRRVVERLKERQD